MNTKEKSEPNTSKKFITTDKSKDEVLKVFFEENENKNENLISSKPSVDSLSIHDIELAIKKADHDALNDVLLDTLSPHLSENEKQKRMFKKGLLCLIKILLIIQLCFVAIPIVLLFMNLCFRLPVANEISEEVIPHLLDFLKYYITAIIAELIAMLFFIVKYVFDKSIVDLVKQMIKK